MFPTIQLLADGKITQSVNSLGMSVYEFSHGHLAVSVIVIGNGLISVATSHFTNDAEVHAVIHDEDLATFLKGLEV